MGNTTFTELEQDVLRAISYDCFYNGEGSSLWSDDVIDECEITTIKQISGVMSSLSKKGVLGNFQSGSRGDSFEVLVDVEELI